MAIPELPAQSRGDILPIDNLDAEIVRAGIAHWRALKGGSRLPNRAALNLEVLGALSDNMFLAAVLDGGADYEYRSVGTSLVQGFNEDFSGRRLSSIITTAPKFGLGLRMLYEMVRASGDPLGYRGWAGDDMAGAAFVYHENAVLPLGRDDGGRGFLVDHILVVSVLVLRPDTPGP